MEGETMRYWETKRDFTLWHLYLFTHEHWTSSYYLICSVEWVILRWFFQITLLQQGWMHVTLRNLVAIYHKVKQHSDHKKWKLFEQFTFIWSRNIHLSTDIRSERKSKQEIGKHKTLGPPSPLLFWAVVGWTVLWWTLLGYTGLFWALVRCTGLYWAVLGCDGLYCAVLGCINWDDFILNISYRTQALSLATIVTIWLTAL